MHHSCTYHNWRTWNAVPRFHFHFTRGLRSVWHTMKVSEFEFELGFRKITEKMKCWRLRSFCIMIGLKSSKFHDRIMLTWRSFKDQVFSKVMIPFESIRSTISEKDHDEKNTIISSRFLWFYIFKQRSYSFRFCLIVYFQQLWSVICNRKIFYFQLNDRIVSVSRSSRSLLCDLGTDVLLFITVTNCYDF